MSLIETIHEKAETARRAIDSLLKDVDVLDAHRADCDSQQKMANSELDEFKRLQEAAIKRVS